MRRRILQLGGCFLTLAACVCLVRAANTPPPDVFERYLMRSYPVMTRMTPPVEAAAVKRRVVRVTGAQEHVELRLRGKAAAVPVLAAGAGRVAETTAQSVRMEHVAYVNHAKVTVESTVEGLGSVEVKPGQVLAAHAVLGTGSATVTFQVRGPREHATTTSQWLELLEDAPDPMTEPTLVLVDQESYRAALFVNGVRAWTRGVAFGQAAGTKERQGDLKTPKGMYFVVGKSTGPFGGDYADYYGGYWVKLNYPNAFDARRGVAQGLLDAQVANGITRAWRDRKLTAQGTRLGGGIGFHGWVDNWDAGPGDAHLSWGCVVMQPTEVGALHDAVELGTMVVIL